MKFLKAFGRFWYEFIIGADWKIAAATATAVALVVGALKLDLFSDTALTVLGALVIMAAFAVSIAIDVRPALREARTRRTQD